MARVIGRDGRSGVDPSIGWPAVRHPDRALASKKGKGLEGDTVTTRSTTQPASEGSTWSRISAFHKTKLVFLAVAFFSFVLSVTLWFFVDREMGVFVGLWVPTLLGLGILVLVGEDDSP